MDNPEKQPLGAPTPSEPFLPPSETEVNPGTRGVNPYEPQLPPPSQNPASPKNPTPSKEE